MSKGIEVELTNPLPLRLQTFDGATDQFPQAHVYASDNSEVAGSPFDLLHVANGLYTNDSFTPASQDTYTAIYIVYSDSGHLTENTTYERDEDSFFVTDNQAEHDATQAAISTLQSQQARTVCVQPTKIFVKDPEKAQVFVKPSQTAKVFVKETSP